MNKQNSSKLIIDSEDKRIYLRKLSVEDVSDDYFNWLHDTEVVQYLEARFSDNTKEDIRKFIVCCTNDPNTVLLGIYFKAENKHIGNIKLHRINYTHYTAEISIMIGNKNYWGEGYGKEAIQLLADYAFSTLKLHKLTAECYANNTGSLKVFKKAGFRLEGTRKKQYICNDHYVDSYILGCVCKKQ